MQSPGGPPSAACSLSASPYFEIAQPFMSDEPGRTWRPTTVHKNNRTYE
jgi:hypothetical protein